MYRTMLKSKIHRATVTHADLHYVGSLTVDEDLMEAADVLAGEQVSVVDVTNGARLDTYVIPGERGSGVLGINGAAAHLVSPGDLVIVISRATRKRAEGVDSRPRVGCGGGGTRRVELGDDPGGAPAGPGLVSGAAVVPPEWPAEDEPEEPAELAETAETVDAARLDELIGADTSQPGPSGLL